MAQGRGGGRWRQIPQTLASLAGGSLLPSAVLVVGSVGDIARLMQCGILAMGFGHGQRQATTSACGSSGCLWDDDLELPIYYSVVRWLPREAVCSRAEGGSMSQTGADTPSHLQEECCTRVSHPRVALPLENHAGHGWLALIHGGYDMPVVPQEQSNRARSKAGRFSPVPARPRLERVCVIPSRPCIRIELPAVARRRLLVGSVASKRLDLVALAHHGMRPCFFQQSRDEPGWMGWDGMAG